MKRIIFTLLTPFIVYFQLSAQYCGNSGPNICTPNVTADTPGLYPTPYCLTPVYVDSNENFTVGFQNFDMAYVLGAEQTIDSLQLDTINNLPQGLCWATNSTRNTYYTNEQGCIQISGRVADTVTPGQYRVNIVATVWLAAYEPNGLTVNASIEGLYYYLRVKSTPADLCPRLIDTTGQAAGANALIPYTGSCDIGTGYVSCGDLPYTVQLSDIISPTPVECTTQISPLFLIINNGVSTLTSDSIIYTYDSGTPNVYVWTGSLATGQLAHISLPATNLSIGNHTLLIISRSPDGQPDGDPVDDTLRLNFSVGQPPVVNITSTTPQCSADTLDAGNAGSTYLWNTSETTEKIVVDTSGIYSVTVTSNNCTATAASNITVYPHPAHQTITGNPIATAHLQYTYSVSSVTGDTYNWNASGGTIQSGQGTNSIIVTWDTPGSHSLTMVESNSDACSDTSTLGVTVVTAINDVNSANASIACDYIDGNNLLRINFSNPSRYSLKLYEISGRVVFEVPGTESTEVMVPGNLSKGIYIVEVNTDEVSLRKKVWVR